MECIAGLVAISMICPVCHLAAVQGYGRLHLGRSLPLAASTLGWNLTVVDRGVFNDTSSNHTYTIQATGRGPLIVVLTYIDWPAWPSLVKPLVNDLDLVVR
jgi:hypothetical protein